MKVFVIDDDQEMRRSLLYLLERSGWEVRAFSDARAALTRLEDLCPDVILSDVRMPGMSGLDLLHSLADKAAPPLVLMTAHGDISMAVEAMQDGAYSFLEKPFDPHSLLRVLRQAHDAFDLQTTNRRLHAQLSSLSGIDRVLLGDSPEMKAVRDEVFQVANTDQSVLILGETGTGKELIARALHSMGPRNDHAFVSINCAAIPDDTIERQLFGEAGGMDGFFRNADGGTLFLDEVGAISMETQAKLLRVLETGELTPVNSGENVTVDVRIVAASNEDLGGRVGTGSFRVDFLFRLNTFQIELPPLRNRSKDVLLLFQHFVAQIAETYEMKSPEMSASDAATLLANSWPGNVRELRHVAERWVLAARRGGASIAAAMRLSDGEYDVPETLREAVAAFERQLIAQSIKAHDGRMDAVADALGIGRRTLNDKIVKLGIDKNSVLTG